MSTHLLSSSVFEPDGYPDPSLVALVEAAVRDEVAIVGELNEVASKHPYYK